jgi:hypothetical protein
MGYLGNTKGKRSYVAVVRGKGEKLHRKASRGKKKNRQN